MCVKLDFWHGLKWVLRISFRSHYKWAFGGGQGGGLSLRSGQQLWCCLRTFPWALRSCTAPFSWGFNKQEQILFGVTLRKIKLYPLSWEEKAREMQDHGSFFSPSPEFQMVLLCKGPGSFLCIPVPAAGGNGLQMTPAIPRAAFCVFICWAGVIPCYSLVHHASSLHSTLPFLLLCTRHS